MKKGIVLFVSLLLYFSLFAQVDITKQDSDSPQFDSILIAIQELNEIIALDSTDASALIERADLLSGVGESEYFATVFGDMDIYQKAIDDYSKAIELRPYSHEGYFKRAYLKDRYLRYDEAIEDYDEALTYAYAKPEKMRIRINRARLKASVGMQDVAINDLEKALLEDHQNHSLLNTLALIHLELDDYPEALKYLNRSLEFHPDDVITFSNIGFVALNSGKYQQAVNIYNEQIKKDSSRSYMYSNRGQAKYKLGKIEEAIEDITKAIELDPINSFAYKNRGMIYFEIGNDDLGCEDLLKAKELGYTVKFGDDVIKLLFEKCLEVNKKPQK